MERWDLLGPGRIKLGRTIARADKDKMEINEYHLAVETWTCDPDGMILITRRDPGKEFPLKWENTGGSAFAGEDSISAMIRELSEETGLTPQPEELTLFFSRMETRAFVDSYLYITKVRQPKIRLQVGETVDSRWISPAQLEEIHRLGNLAYSVARRLEAYRDRLFSLIEAKTTGHTIP